jgi:hypothetical protein
MINVSELIVDPDFARPLTLTRSTGHFARGGFTTESKTIPITGIANPAAGSDLEQLPEGDRVTGAMTFYTTVPVYATRSGPQPGVSDVITLNGEHYRIAKIMNRSANGFYKSIGVRTDGL